VVAALALRWLSTRLGPALRTLRARLQPRLAVLAAAPAVNPILVPATLGGRQPVRRAGRAPPH
jgi:hypothetical protein